MSLKTWANRLRGLACKNRTEFPRLFTMTVDVEPDAGPGWKTSSPITFTGVYEGVSRLDALARECGVRVTYFLNPVVMHDPRSVRLLSDLSPERAELATHLHGDYVAPQARYPGPDFSGCDPVDMQCEYSPEVEFEKLANLTALFEEKFGCRPKSFRAGRFGARGWTIDCLRRLGYTHDSSVTPFRNWYGKADFSKAEWLAPYPADPGDILKRGESGVIEVPVTITKKMKWLRPTPGFSDLKEMQDVVKTYEGLGGALFLCSMIHNVELVPGVSPYCESQQQCDQMLESLRALFVWLRDRGYQPAFVKDACVGY